MLWAHALGRPCILWFVSMGLSIRNKKTAHYFHVPSCDERFLGYPGTSDVRNTKSMGVRECYVADDEHQPCTVQCGLLFKGS